MTSHRRRYGFFLCLWLGLGMGCDRNVGPYDPGELPQEPDLRRIFPELRAANPPPPVSPDGPPPGSRFPARPRARPEGRRGRFAEARGAVDSRSWWRSRAEDLRPDAALSGASLFIIARTARGPAQAPRLRWRRMRVEAPQFPPLLRDRSSEHVMIPGRRFEGELCRLYRAPRFRWQRHESSRSGRSLGRAASELPCGPGSAEGPGDRPRTERFSLEGLGSVSRARSRRCRGRLGGARHHQGVDLPGGVSIVPGGDVDRLAFDSPAAPPRLRIKQDLDPRALAQLELSQASVPTYAVGRRDLLQRSKPSPRSTVRPLPTALTCCSRGRPPDRVRRVSRRLEPAGITSRSVDRADRFRVG